MSETVTNRPLELVHLDPVKTRTPKGEAYYLAMVDDFTKFSEVALLRGKDEARSML